MDKELGTKILELSEQLGALKYGDFTLASGAKSNYYYDGRLISLNPEGAYWIGKAFLENLKNDHIVAVGGPATAAIPIVTSIALMSQIAKKPVEGFFVRQEAKAYGRGRQIEGKVDPGSRVAIVDDVCTSGASLFTAIEAIEALECKVVRVMTVLDRFQGGSDELRRKGYNFCCLLEPDPHGQLRVSLG